ncbi:MAG: N-acetyltransferase [Candidatus Heimdallarchaeota archaeon]|nr:MAG: N-acetyltransferase [Candidatus Heimdallarchaeota archaeon]
MSGNQGFQSKRAVLESRSIAKSSCIYGSSQIGRNSIIDPFVIIGYPIRVKTKNFTEKNMELPLENSYDKISNGSIIGKNNHIRPFTIIYENSQLENDVETGTNVVIRENCQIGLGSIIGSGTILDSGVSIGKRARIQSSNFIPPKIILGDNIFLGPGVRFANDPYPVSKELTTTIVEDNVIIGIGAIILAGITIKERAVIAAGSVVTKDVPSEHVMMGTPARRVMSREEYDTKQKMYESSFSD